MLIFGDTIDTLISGTVNHSNQTMAQRNTKLEDEMSEQAYYYLIVSAGILLTTYIQVRFVKPLECARSFSRYCLFAYLLYV